MKRILYGAVVCFLAGAMLNGCHETVPEVTADISAASDTGEKTLPAMDGSTNGSDAMESTEQTAETEAVRVIPPQPSVIPLKEEAAADVTRLLSENYLRGAEEDTTVHPAYQRASATVLSGTVLENAAAFYVNGCHGIVNGKLYRISYTSDDAVPFVEEGVYWLPLSVPAAAFDADADYHAASGVLHMTLDGRRYTYTAGSDTADVDGTAVPLGFRVREQYGALFVPAEHLMTLFGYSELDTDAQGMLLLSNCADALDSIGLTESFDILCELFAVRPSGETILSDMYARLGGDAHPRLLLTESDFDVLREAYKSDSAYRSLVSQLVFQYGPSSAEFKDDPVRYEIPDGHRLIVMTRKAKNRVIPWCFLYQLTGASAYAERAWKDIEAVCSFIDWNPQHYLDVGEMSYMMAVAYDWLYDYLTPERRELMERAVNEKSLIPTLTEHRAGRGWGCSNWNPVCNGGTMAMALAYSSVYPEKCAELLGYAIRNAEIGFLNYAPDGGYLEGPAYWNYGTEYTQILLAVLESACGTDYGLFYAPGFSETAAYPYTMGTGKHCWNYHDAGDAAIDTQFISWFSRRTGNDSWRALRQSALESGAQKASIYDLLWYDASAAAEDAAADPANMQPDTYYSQAGIVTMRSAWDDNALFTGLHGGSNAESHGDLDIGNFILDAFGIRFVTDLGGENYNVPRYFNELRFTYYRKRAEGHNTLVVGDVSCKVPDQNADASAEILRTESSAGSALAVVDMTPAYDAMTRGVRGLLLTDDRSVVIVQDEASFSSPQTVRWQLHTEGTIRISEDGRTALIDRGVGTLYCEIVSEDTTARFSTSAAVSYDPAYPVTSGEHARTSVSKLLIVSENVCEYRMAVVMKPYLYGGETPAENTLYTWTDIADWSAADAN
ncbi:MAG: heparinase II/III family protein [Eubacteriales bacterium]